MIPIIPVDLNITLNTTVCTVCLNVYNDINEFFLQLTQGENKRVCMDIVDSVRWRKHSSIDSIKSLIYLDEYNEIIVE